MAKRVKSKSKKRIVKLVSSANTGHFYATYISKSTKKISLKKYDPVIRQRVIYNQKKIT